MKNNTNTISQFKTFVHDNLSALFIFIYLFNFFEKCKCALGFVGILNARAHKENTNLNGSIFSPTLSKINIYSRKTSSSVHFLSIQLQTRQLGEWSTSLRANKAEIHPGRLLMVQQTAQSAPLWLALLFGNAV